MQQEEKLLKRYGNKSHSLAIPTEHVIAANAFMVNDCNNTLLLPVNSFFELEHKVLRRKAAISLMDLVSFTLLLTGDYCSDGRMETEALGKVIEPG